MIVMATKSQLNHVEPILFTQEQLSIALLEQKNDTFYKALTEIKADMKSHFNWMMGSISVLYLTLIGTLVTVTLHS